MRAWVRGLHAVPFCSAPRRQPCPTAGGAAAAPRCPLHQTHFGGAVGRSRRARAPRLRRGAGPAGGEGEDGLQSAPAHPEVRGRDRETGAEGERGSFGDAQRGWSLPASAVSAPSRCCPAPGGRAAAVKKELRDAFERDSAAVTLSEQLYPDINVITGQCSPRSPPGTRGDHPMAPTPTPRALSPQGS